MTTYTANTFDLSHFSLSPAGYTNVVCMPCHLIAHAASGVTLISRSAVQALTLSSHKKLLVLHLAGSQKLEVAVSAEIGQAVADWFFGQPLPPPEITALEQNAFEAAYREYLRAQAV